MTKVLIVEDKEDMITGLIFNLEAQGYETCVAYDGAIFYHVDGVHKTYTLSTRSTTHTSAIHGDCDAGHSFDLGADSGCDEW